ncbi:hypothetical protein JRO89_XS04G0265200 [Xanthoceras sorbifolium]|uniref:Galactokinase n=1 Tax=Xanthoceras sorbifolium TaxID=99658 RepID=A0ABQ8I7H4_9ROSI|nr:hypothetical protein JRO89_XS04G0265200 [Xanthoceras sorbifolium]
MGLLSWPTETELDEIRKKVSLMAGTKAEEVRVVASPYRICPLGAHIDHQGGTVSAMTINKGILLGFIPSGDTQGLLDMPCLLGFLYCFAAGFGLGSFCKLGLAIFLVFVHAFCLMKFSEAAYREELATYLKNNCLENLDISNKRWKVLLSVEDIVVLQSGQFKGEVRFRVDEIQRPRHTVKENNSKHASDFGKMKEDCSWGNYAKGAHYALQSRGNNLAQGIIGYICGSESLDSSGLSSSAAVSLSFDAVLVPVYEVGVAYLLALENANGIEVSPVDNIEYDRQPSLEILPSKLGLKIVNWFLNLGILVCANVNDGILYSFSFLKYHAVANDTMMQLIENEYLGLRNGILDQSAILLSSYGCLTCMNCKTKEYKLIQPPKFHEHHKKDSYKILLALSGFKGALTNNPGYNHRVAECQEAARVIL